MMLRFDTGTGWVAMSFMGHGRQGRGGWERKTESSFLAMVSLSVYQTLWTP